MQSRCAVQFGNDRKKLILTGQDNETLEHLALKLAGFVLFFGWDPVVEISPKHPALNGQEFRPDLPAFNSAGEIFLWIECGNVTTHKLDKIIRRNRQARIVVLKGTEREAHNLRRALEKNEVTDAGRVEILAFPEGRILEWAGILDDSVEVYGEVSERSFN